MPIPGELVPIVSTYLKEVRTQSSGLGFSIYDTAWVLAAEILPENHQNDLLNKILRLQNTDGTWGESGYLPHSAVVDTLATVWSLQRLGKQIPNLENIGTSLDCLLRSCTSYDKHPTVAFEFIAPLLAKNVSGIELNSESTDYLNKIFESSKPKLDYIRAKIGFFDPSHTLSFTGEIAVLLNDFTDQEAATLSKAQLSNGSIGLSPAATAGAIILSKERGIQPNQAYKDYLLTTLTDYHNEGFPSLHPYEHTRRLWNLVPWILSGNIDTLLQTSEGKQTLLDLYNDLLIDDKGRVSWDTCNTALPDLDDTSVALALHYKLKAYGVENIQEMTHQSLNHFRNSDGTFFCYPLELHPSPVALMHALMAIEIGGQTYGDEFIQNPEVQSIIQSLLDQIAPENDNLDEHTLEHLCHDKWHGTWTYGFQRWLSINLISNRQPQLVHSLVEFALNREQNGGWGQHNPTLEETAYVYTGLSIYLERIYQGLVIEDDTTIKKIQLSLENSKKYIREETGKMENQRAIWVSKNTYVPAWYQSAILVASMMTQ